MSEPEVKIRRGRRRDFDAVMELLAGAGVAVPAADRSTLRRFRHITTDLGTDFYLAERDRRIVGLLHVSYARQLTRGQRARIEQLVVADAAGEIGGALLDFAATRARKRACTTLYCSSADLPPAGARFLIEQRGLVAHGSEYRADL